MAPLWLHVKCHDGSGFRARIYLCGTAADTRRTDLKTVTQLTIYDDPAAAAAWSRATASRSSYLAAPTTRMLELAGIGQGHRVLVVGTGTGQEALEAARLVGARGEVIATDVSAAMIAEAKRAVAAAGVTNARCLVMDGQRLKFRAGTFDAVIARNALMFIPDVGQALAEMNRVLKQSGRVAATVWASARRNPRLSDHLEAARALGVKAPEMATFRIALRFGSQSTLAAALKAAGFSDVVVERWPVTARFDTVKLAVQQALDHPGTRELMHLISGDSSARMARSLERRWQKYTGADGVHLPGEQLVVVGTKPAQREA
jgi:ubiquinone/menaquinone biosynthesis C-methylase UbiE